MTTAGVLQILLFFGVVLLVTKPIGLFMARVFQGERTFLHPLLRPVEALIYRACGVSEEQEQRWLGGVIEDFVQRLLLETLIDECHHALMLVAPGQLIETPVVDVMYGNPCKLCALDQLAGAPIVA